MTSRVLFILLLLCTFALDDGNARTLEISSLRKFEGLYRDAAGRVYLLNPSEEFPHIAELGTGKTHMLRVGDQDEFEFSGTRNAWQTIGGTISLDSLGGIRSLCIRYAGTDAVCLQPIPMKATEQVLVLGDSIQIAGTLYAPEEPLSALVAVLLHGDGENDRYNLFDIGMFLIEAGHSVFAFDKRNAGQSSGPQVEGDNYDDISRVYARDAAAVIRALKDLYPHSVFGVIGISQGGWIGSMVSAQVPDLAFYVNIAGNVSIGYEQWRHYMLSYLKRSGFEGSDVEEATEYFEAFIGVGLGQNSFGDYQELLARYEEKEWFRRLAQRKYIRWTDAADARSVVGANSFDPTGDVARVRAPTLGIFYEFDHSTPPDSPVRFEAALRKSGSPEFVVKTFPNSTHGGWVVDSYYFNTSEITRFEPRAYEFVVEWLNGL